MTPAMAALSALLAYKLGSLMVGMVMCILGYRLFVSGIWGQSGDMKATLGDNKIVLRGAAPGTFFAVLGAAVIIAVVSKGLDVNAGWTPQLAAAECIDGGPQAIDPERPPATTSGDQSSGLGSGGFSFSGGGSSGSGGM